jgi:hypothetical protein
MALAYEWESAFSQTDVQGHSFRFTNINGSGTAAPPTAPSGPSRPATPKLPNLPVTLPGGVGPVAGEGGLPPAVEFLLGSGQ